MPRLDLADLADELANELADELANELADELADDFVHDFLNESLHVFCVPVGCGGLWCLRPSSTLFLNKISLTTHTCEHRTTHTITITGPMEVMDPNMESKIAEFSAWLARHAEAFPRDTFHAYWDAERVNAMEIQPIKKKYTEVFGYEPSGNTVFRMVSREYLHVLPNGWAMHPMGPKIPDFLTHAIQLLGVETKMARAEDIPGSNLPPNLQIPIWKL